MDPLASLAVGLALAYCVAPVGAFRGFLDGWRAGGPAHPAMFMDPAEFADWLDRATPEELEDFARYR